MKNKFSKPPVRVILPDDYQDCPECGNMAWGVNQSILVCTDCGHPVRLDEIE